MAFKLISFVLWFFISIVTCYSDETMNKRNNYITSPEERHKMGTELKKKIMQKTYDMGIIDDGMPYQYVQDIIPIDEES